MSVRTWLDSFKPCSSRTPLRRQATAGSRLRFEVLEERALLATFTVTNLLDSGPDSLRAAIEAANANPGPDAIEFATTGTVALTSGPLDITDSLTISGPGASNLTVSGSDASRVFGLAGDFSALIADLTIAHGKTSGSPGGGISVDGSNLTLARVAVSENSAVGITGGQGAGGGIYLAGGTLTLDQVTVFGNSAIGGAGEGGYAVLYGGEGGEGAGGGIYVAGGAVYINQSVISGNLAVGGAGGDSDQQYWTGWENTYGGNGGGAAGGGIRVAAGTVEFYESAISGNTANGGFGGSGTFNGWSGVGVGGGVNFAPAAPPLADLDTFTELHTTNNIADTYPDIAGPYSLNGTSPPSISISDASIVEGDAGTRAAAFTVILSAASSQAVSVRYTNSSGTATAGSDYQVESGMLTIPAGQKSGMITVLVNGDRLGEANETFVITLSNAINATISDAQGQGTILDDEPSIRISDVSKSEGRKGMTTLFTFTVTLSAPADQPVTVSYRTVNGTATTGNNDYVAKTGTLTFAPGETTKAITIEVKGDSKREANETFYLDLFANSSNSSFTKSRGFGTILNDD